MAKKDIFGTDRTPQLPSANRMSIVNAFELNAEQMWVPCGKQLIYCMCGFTDGFRVFPEGDIAKSVTDHNLECHLLEGRDRSKI